MSRKCQEGLDWAWRFTLHEIFWLRTTPGTGAEQEEACLHVLEERREERPVALFLKGGLAVGLPQGELGMLRHLQRIQAPLQQLIRLFVLSHGPAIGKARPPFRLCSFREGILL